MSGDSILRTVREKYLLCTSYSDFGTVDIVPRQDEVRVRAEFRTYFVRPSRVRFEWRNSASWEKEEHIIDCAIWSNGQNSYRWIFDKLEPTDVVQAVRSADGFSSGASLKIIKLLLPQIAANYHDWTHMTDIKELEEQDVDSVSCYHLVGTTTDTDDKECWIGKDDFLVRRLRCKTDITAEQALAAYEQIRQYENLTASKVNIRKELFVACNFYHEYTYHQVQINQPLPNELFEFDGSEPPAMSSAWT